jgi:hypothetical protein
MPADDRGLEVDRLQGSTQEGELVAQQGTGDPRDFGDPDAGKGEGPPGPSFNDVIRREAGYA